MTVFEEACLLSCEEWVDSFPSEIPKHRFSKQHNDKIKELLNGQQTKEKYTFSKKTIKFLVIAAILLSIATTAFAIPASREFIIKKLFSHSTYSVVDDSNYDEVNSLTLNYIPDDFLAIDEYENKYVYSISYRSDDYYFFVDKHPLNTQIDFDTEKYAHENIMVNGKQGVFYKVNDLESGIIFNNGYYIFLISGNITKEELVKIAQGLE